VDLRVRQPQRLHLLPNAADGDSVEQKVRRRVVAQHCHEDGGVAHAQRRPGMHELENATPGNLIDLQNRERVIERKLLLLDLVIKRYENRNLDQAGRRKRFVATQREPLARIEIRHRVAEHAVVRRGDRVELLVQRRGVRADERLLPSRGRSAERHDRDDSPRLSSHHVTTPRLFSNGFHASSRRMSPIIATARSSSSSLV